MKNKSNKKETMQKQAKKKTMKDIKRENDIIRIDHNFFKIEDLDQQSFILRTILNNQNNDVLEGKLVKVNDTEIELNWKAREPKPIGKGKVTVQKEAVLEYKNIVEATVVITFK